MAIKEFEKPELREYTDVPEVENKATAHLAPFKSKEEFQRLLLLGLGTIILLQALMHMSVSVNLIPVTGQTLPLISNEQINFFP